MKAMSLLSFVVLLSSCAGYDRREDRREDRRDDLRSELQTTQPASMLSAMQITLPVRPS